MSLIDMSIAGGCVILAAALIRMLGMNRLPRRAFLALWLIAGLRLILPISIPFRLSIYSLLASRAPATAAPAAPAIPAVTAAPGTAVPGMAVTPILPAAAPQVNVTLAVPETAATVTVSLWPIVWAVGMAVCAALFALGYARWRRTFRASLPVESQCVSRWLDENRLLRPVEVRQSDRIGAPLTYGLMRPVILLPGHMDLDDEQTLSLVLAHEYAHIRRLDAFWKLALAGVLCLHWFNPAVWVMYVLAGRDMELACDETVIRRCGPDGRKAYANALLTMEETRGGFMALGNSFSKNAIEERIVSIMKIRPKSMLSILLAAVLVLGTAAVFATSASAAETPEPATRSIRKTTEMSPEDAAMTELALRRLEDRYPSVAQWLRENYTTTVWWTWEGYQAMMEQQLADLESLLGHIVGSTSTTAQVVVTRQMIDEERALHEDTLQDIRDGWMISKSVGGDENSYVAINPDDIVSGTGDRVLACTITLKDNTSWSTGPYNTVGDLLTVLIPFCNKQVHEGNLSAEDARQIIAPYMVDVVVATATTDEGKTAYSWDGLHFYGMTEEEAELLFPTPEVEWWTYEEYAAWLEEEKLALQDCLGSRAWTNTDGWFTWTQEKIDQTVAMYEQTLENIKNGALVSKTVDGSADVVLASGGPMFGTVFSVADDDTITGGAPEEFVVASVEDERFLAGIFADREKQWEDTLEPYMSFGVSYEYDAATDDFKMYWGDVEVRGIMDEEAGMWITEHAGIGSYGEEAVELYAVYEDGELAGLRQATDQEQEAWTRIRRSVSAGQAADDANISFMTANVADIILSDDDARLFHASSAGTDSFAHLAPGHGVAYAAKHIGSTNTVTISITTTRECELIVGLRSTATGQFTGKVLACGGEGPVTVILSPDVSGKYELYIQNPGPTSVEYSLSYIIT